MTTFKIDCKGNYISAIYDSRYQTPVDITDGAGRFGQLVYTLSEEDITKADKPEFAPYEEHYASYSTCRHIDNGILMENEEFSTTLRIAEEQEHPVFEMQCDSEMVSACGMFLPLNFLSCKNGKREQQFLISSPYHTADKKHWMHYFTRTDGKNLAFIVEGELEGYKINYSPYLAGHYIRGFSFLWRLDRAYHTDAKTELRMRVHMIPVASYEEAMQWATKIWDIPAIYYHMASVKQGEIFEFQMMGEPDWIRILSPSGKMWESKELSFKAEEYGIYQLVPYKNGEPGMDVSVFVWDDMQDMYRKAMDTLLKSRDEIIGHTSNGTPIWRPPHLFYRGFPDHNLCEHGMWCWAMLRYMRRHGKVKEYVEEVENFLHIVIPENGGYTNHACSIIKEQGYLTKDSTRIQEAYGGVNILLDAWRVFGEEKYLEFAIDTLTARLEADMNAKGGIMRHGSDGATAEVADYTTVTCMVFPVVDLAVELKRMRDDRYQYFESMAIKIADYIVERGLSFPTEGGEHPEVNEELEEGSISCSALTVCYVAAHLCKKQKYLDFAKEILELHDAFSVYTPHPVLFRSSLRWWETIWEGDSDGPAVCFGHAWSLWRAEAQFWYGLLTCDSERLLDSYNGFMGNYAKEDRDGNVYTIYQYEPMSGGALATNGKEMNYRVHEGFPDRPDETISRYLFARDFECWQSSMAVIELEGKTFFLDCHKEGERIVFDGTSLKRIYLDMPEGRYAFATSKEVEVIGPQKYQISREDNCFIVVVNEEMEETYQESK